MILRHIQLTNFKNIERAELSFSPKINCLLGDNGQGKSNLLDAIYFLSFCKSFTGAPDAMLINRNEDFAMVSADYTRHGSGEILDLALQRGKRKSLKRGHKAYQKLSDHIGLFPLVLVAPSDMDLVNGSGEERRRLLDMVISQTDARYLDMLIRYGHALEQRNRMLRDGVTDPFLYQAVEAGMEAAADYICAKRGECVARLAEIFERSYAEIAGSAEVPSLTYKSHLSGPGARLSDIFDERRGRDAALGFTSAGPHRDDLEMELSGLPLRRSASQGQAKTYTIALRFAQYEFLKEGSGMAPLLLLDDIFDKLDASRVAHIMQIAASDAFGQIFITDTNRKHLDEILDYAGGEYALWTVADGNFSRKQPGEA